VVPGQENQMKASNKFRATRTFSILSTDAKNIARIVAKYGNKLTAISHQHVPKAKSLVEMNSYVLRIIEADRSLVDVEVYVDSLDNVIETERLVIIAGAQPDFRYSQRGGVLFAVSPAACEWVKKNFLPDRLTHGVAKLFVDDYAMKNIEQRVKADGLSLLVAP
jgi:hypothetical protein